MSSSIRERIIAVITDALDRPWDVISSQTASPEQLADLVIEAIGTEICDDRHRRDLDHECRCVMQPGHLALIPNAGHGCRCGQIWGCEQGDQRKQAQMRDAARGLLDALGDRDVRNRGLHRRRARPEPGGHADRLDHGMPEHCGRLQHRLPRVPVSAVQGR